MLMHVYFDVDGIPTLEHQRPCFFGLLVVVTAVALCNSSLDLQHLQAQQQNETMSKIAKDIESDFIVSPRRITPETFYNGEHYSRTNYTSIALAGKLKSFDSFDAFLAAISELPFDYFQVDPTGNLREYGQRVLEQ